jgi:formyltetrahydrofolate deformylase
MRCPEVFALPMGRERLDGIQTLEGRERTGLTMCYNIRLLIDCPDHRGLIAAVSGFIALHNGNILSADEHVSDAPSGTFLMRMEIEGRGFGLGRDEFDAAFAPLARQYGMR